VWRRAAPREALRGLAIPPATATWKAVPHEALVSEMERQLADRGLMITRQKFAVLFDPYSAVYEFTREPRHGWVHPVGSPPVFGWKVSGTLNAKNRFGGYVGAKPFFIIIKDEKVIYSSRLDL
jgi:hypothetical protein